MQAPLVARLIPLLALLLLLLQHYEGGITSSRSTSHATAVAAFVVKTTNNNRSTIRPVHRRGKRGSINQDLSTRLFLTASSSPSSSPIQRGEISSGSGGGGTTTTAGNDNNDKSCIGLYRPIADMVWKMLLDDNEWLELEESSIDKEFQSNVAPAKGMDGFVVRMETRALQRRKSSCGSPSPSSTSHPPPPLCYARMALLETIPDATAASEDDDDDLGITPSSTEGDNISTTTVQTSGIQVLNLVLFPSRQTTLPVWGADFVSLPGNKHLMLLDAQPMNGDRSYENCWSEWYANHVMTRIPQQLFAWGGDLPEPVLPFVSQYALWTRWGPGSDNDDDDENEMPIPSRIQGPLTEAVQEHLEVYLQLLLEHHTNNNDDDEAAGENRDGETNKSTPPVVGEDNNSNYQEDYIRYRLDNDPARPMLRSLYGEEWTENVLSRVLFPQ